MPSVIVLIFHNFDLLFNFVGELCFIYFVVLFVVHLTHSFVAVLEVLHLVVGNNDEHVGEHFRRLWHKVTVIVPFFIHVVSEVPGHQISALLLSHSVILSANFVDIVLLSLYLVIFCSHFLSLKSDV